MSRMEILSRSLRGNRPSIEVPRSRDRRGATRGLPCNLLLSASSRGRSIYIKTKWSLGGKTVYADLRNPTIEGCKSGGVIVPFGGGGPLDAYFKARNIFNERLNKAESVTTN